MNGPLDWIASIGTIIAASLIAFDLGRRATAWGFVLFCAVAMLWMLVRGPLRFFSMPPLAAPKVFLGVPLFLYILWRWLVRPFAAHFGPFSAYAALCCSAPALVAQCYVVSFPLAGSVAPLLGAFAHQQPL